MIAWNILIWVVLGMHINNYRILAVFRGLDLIKYKPTPNNRAIGFELFDENLSRRDVKLKPALPLPQDR